MINEEIETKMREFAEVLKYKFNDISWLKKAMGSKKLKLKDREKIVLNMIMKDWLLLVTQYSNLSLRIICIV